MSFLPDPCPLPEQLKKRSLNAKERLIYAPMSGVGGVMYDKDAVYIDLGGSHHPHKIKVRLTNLYWSYSKPYNMIPAYHNISIAA